MALSPYDLPPVNACLNGLSAIFLAAGYYFIRQRNVRAHRRCMLVALTASGLFLICYLTYHYFARATHFKGEGWIRPVYFTILISHTILAVCILPLVFLSVSRVLQRRLKAHRAISRWTWPLWMYVSVTGVVIYFLLYHLYPSR